MWSSARTSWPSLPARRGNVVSVSDGVDPSTSAPRRAKRTVRVEIDQAVYDALQDEAEGRLTTAPLLIAMLLRDRHEQLEAVE
jgi:hypothetical protein